MPKISSDAIFDHQLTTIHAIAVNSVREDTMEFFETLIKDDVDFRQLVLMYQRIYAMRPDEQDKARRLRVALRQVLVEKGRLPPRGSALIEGDAPPRRVHTPPIRRHAQAQGGLLNNEDFMRSPDGVEFRHDFRQARSAEWRAFRQTYLAETEGGGPGGGGPGGVGPGAAGPGNFQAGNGTAIGGSRSQVRRVPADRAAQRDSNQRAAAAATGIAPWAATLHSTPGGEGTAPHLAPSPAQTSSTRQRRKSANPLSTFPGVQKVRGAVSAAQAPSECGGASASSQLQAPARNDPGARAQRKRTAARKRGSIDPLWSEDCPSKSQRRPGSR